MHQNARYHARSSQRAVLPAGTERRPIGRRDRYSTTASQSLGFIPDSRAARFRGRLHGSAAPTPPRPPCLAREHATAASSKGDVHERLCHAVQHGDDRGTRGVLSRGRRSEQSDVAAAARLPVQLPHVPQPDQLPGRRLPPGGTRPHRFRPLGDADDDPIHLQLRPAHRNHRRPDRTPRTATRSRSTSTTTAPRSACGSPAGAPNGSPR